MDRHVIEIVDGQGHHVREIALQSGEFIRSVSQCGHVLKVFVGASAKPKAKAKPQAATPRPAAVSDAPDTPAPLSKRKRYRGDEPTK